MNTGISQNDKKLLIALGTICILLIYVFFVARPLIITNRQLKAQMAENEEKIEILQTNGLALRTVQEENQSLKEQLNQDTQNLYPILRAQEISKLLTDSVGDFMLTVKRLQITTAEGSADVKAFGREKEEGSNPDFKEGIWIANVELQVTGDSQSLDEFIDVLSLKMPGIMVRNISWSWSDSSKMKREPDANYDMATLQLDILMVRKE